MDLDTTSTYGPFLYRIRTAVGPGLKVIAVVQRRKWFLWRDHQPVGNARIELGNEIMQVHKRLLDLVSLYDEMENDEKKAAEFVQQNSVRDGVSRPFRGQPSPRQEKLPDNSKEVGAVIDQIKKGIRTSGASLKAPNFKDKSEDARKAGTRMAFIPDKHRSILQGLSRSWQAEQGVDHVLEFKGLDDQQKQGQNQRNKGRNQNQNNNQGQNRQNNDGTDDKG